MATSLLSLTWESRSRAWRQEVRPTCHGTKFLTEPGAKGGLNAALAWHAGLRLLAASAGFEYTPDTAPQLVRQFLFSGETHLMVLGHNHDPTFRALSDMASLHIQMRERCGRVFVTGEKPRAPNFLLFPGNDQDPYQLVPLV